MAINIQPSHRGLFTKKANAAGESVQRFAEKKAHAGGVLGKEANFARMAKRHWKPLGKKAKYHKMAKAMK
jgi:hypothetical protein